MPSDPEYRRVPIDASRLLSQGKRIVRPVLVGGTLQTGWVVAPSVTAAIVIAIGILIGFRGGVWEPLFYICLPIAAIGAVLGGVAASVQLARRRYLEVTPTGFVVIFRNAERRAFDDEQIVAITQQTWPSSDGSYFRRVVVEVAAEEYLDPVECFYHVPAGQQDPLYWLVDRNVRSLAKRTADHLHLGARLTGAGWHYDRDGLHLHHGPHRGIYAPDELTFLAFYNGQMKVWRGIEELPMMTIPDTSRNAHTLGQVLWAFMENRPGLTDPVPGRPLGRLLFVKRGRDHWLGWCLTALFGAAGALCLGYAATTRGGAEQVTFGILGGLCAFLLLLGLWLVYRSSYMRLAYHQFGVAQPGRGRWLLFTEIGRMIWTPHSIVFDPLPDAGRPGIRFQTVSVEFDNDLIGMRDYVSSVIAQRWWEELGKGPVTWTGALRFLPGGLEYRPSGVFGRGEPVMVPYHITSYYLLQGWMELFVTGEPRAVLKEMYTVPNFYPGLTLLNWIYESMKQQAAQQPGQQAEARPDFSLPFRASSDKVAPSERPGPNVTPAEG